MNSLEYLLKKYPNKSWDWEVISYNPNITMKIIKKYPYGNWDWYEISKNSQISLIRVVLVKKLHVFQLSLRQFFFILK